MLISDNLNDIVKVYKTADGIDNESDHIPVICSFNFECAYLTKMETQHYPSIPGWNEYTTQKKEWALFCLFCFVFDDLNV